MNQKQKPLEEKNLLLLFSIDESVEKGNRVVSNGYTNRVWHNTECVSKKYEQTLVLTR